MDHTIKVKIADRSYSQTIHSELEEEAIRNAAKSVNEKISALSGKFAEIPMVDILTIVALNEGIEKFELQEKMKNEERSLEKLSADLGNYVESLK